MKRTSPVVQIVRGWCLFSAILCRSTLASPEPSEPFNNESIVSKRPEDAGAVAQAKEFLKYLQTLAPVMSKPGSGHIDGFSGKRIDPQVFLGYVSSTGIDFTTRTGTKIGKVTRDDLRGQLKNQRGPVVSIFREIAYNLKGTLSNSRRYDREDADTFSVTLGEYYVLVFKRESGFYRLSDLHDIAPELGD